MTTEDSSEEIRHDIDETRAQLSETIDAMQERLNPETLKEQAKDAVRTATIGKAQEAFGDATDAAKGASGRMQELIRQNPVPAALAGIGIGWLVMKSREKPYPVGGSSGQLTNQLSDAAGAGKEQAERAIAQVQQTATQTVDQTRGQAQRLLQENPLVVGGVAVALGAAVGLALQPTQQENRLVGPQRDRLMEQLKSTAKETQEKVEHVAAEVQKTVVDEAKNQELTA